MGELLGLPKAGRLVCNAVAHFPRLDVQAQVQPMTRSMLRFELTITPKFEWNDFLHGGAEIFWILIEDCDGEEILFHDTFVLRKSYALAEMNEHLVEMTVPISEPMPPNYFVTVLSDRWMHSETKLPVSFQKLLLPEKFPPHTPLLDLQPLPVAALKREEFINLYTQPFMRGIRQTVVTRVRKKSSIEVSVCGPIYSILSRRDHLCADLSNKGVVQVAL